MTVAAVGSLGAFGAGCNASAPSGSLAESGGEPIAAFEVGTSCGAFMTSLGAPASYAACDPEGLDSTGPNGLVNPAAVCKGHGPRTSNGGPECGRCCLQMDWQEVARRMGIPDGQAECVVVADEQINGYLMRLSQTATASKVDEARKAIGEGRYPDDFRREFGLFGPATTECDFVRAKTTCAELLGDTTGTAVADTAVTGGACDSQDSKTKGPATKDAWHCCSKKPCHELQGDMISRDPNWGEIECRYDDTDQSDSSACPNGGIPTLVSAKDQTAGKCSACCAKLNRPSNTACPPERQGRLDDFSTSGVSADMKEQLRQVFQNVIDNWGCGTARPFNVKLVLDNRRNYAEALTTGDTMTIWYPSASHPVNQLQIAAHEFVHIINRQHYGHRVGDNIINEGTADFFRGNAIGRGYRDMRETLCGSIAQKLTYPYKLATPRNQVTSITPLYYHWSSFVQFLIERKGGRTAFDKLVEISNRNDNSTLTVVGTASYREVYGQSLEELEREWWTWTGCMRPRADDPSRATFIPQETGGFH